jgi:pimeloyl-ACP methyl ester carboxylesterase
MKKSIPYKNGVDISFAECGSVNGFPIFINHGLIAGIDDYSLFERLIELNAHLICIARPGYGDSSPYVMQDIAAWSELAAVLIDHLQLAQFDVLGMSSGAPYSYALGYAFPDKVRNIYIFSGIPALFDDQVLSYWPFAVKKDATIPEMQLVAHELFFSNLSARDLDNLDIKDSMRNDCFGVAQDLKLRCIDWGFTLSEVRANTYMQHCKTDDGVPFITALLTSRMLPNCKLVTRENGEHFSKESLEEFIDSVIAEHYQNKAPEKNA